MSNPFAVNSAAALAFDNAINAGRSEVEAELMGQIAGLTEDKAALQKQVDSPKAISLKVSEKGALSLYGMGRFPVTLYKEQWLTVLNKAEEIKAFITANDSKLKAKEDETVAEAAARRARVETYSREAAAKHAASQAQGQNAYKPGDGQTSHKAV